MWFFKKKKQEEPKSGKLVKRLVTGLIIGGAIGSVIGNKLLDKHEEDEGDELAEGSDENSPD